MQNICSNSKAELSVIKARTLAAGIETLELASTSADKKVAITDINFLADWDIYLHNVAFCYSYNI